MLIEVRPPSPATHGKALSVLGDYANHPAVRRMAEILSVGRVGWEKIVAVVSVIDGDGSLTDDGKLIDLDDFAHRHIDPVFPRSDEARGATLKAIAATEAEIRQAIRSPDPRFDQEVRARMASLPQEERRKLLAEGRPEVVGADLSGPAVLSGMTEAELELLRSTSIRKHRPELADRLEALQKSVQIHDRGMHALQAMRFQISAAATKAREARDARKRAVEG